MELGDYTRIYLDLQAAANQTGIVGLCAADALREFPRRLPEESREAAMAVLADISRKARVIVEAHERGDEGPLGTELDDTELDDTELDDNVLEARMGLLTADLFLLKVTLAGETEFSINFERLLHAQELMTLFAHLDAFLSDTVKAMCVRDRRLLRRGKQIKWEEVLNCGDWDSLLARLTEDYVYEFGWKSVREKIQCLRKEHGLEIRTSDEELDFIENAEQRRHVIVHNGGRASQAFLDKTGDRSLVLGDLVPMTGEYNQALGDTLRMLASDVYVAVATKFFQADAGTLKGVWRSPAS